MESNLYRSRFSSGIDGHGDRITNWQEELVTFIKDILGAIWKDIGLNLKQMVRLAGIGYNKSLLDRHDLYCDIANKRKGAQERLKRLRQGEHKMFGGQVGSLNKALKGEVKTVVILTL